MSTRSDNAPVLCVLAVLLAMLSVACNPPPEEVVSNTATTESNRPIWAGIDPAGLPSGPLVEDPGNSPFVLIGWSQDGAVAYVEESERTEEHELDFAVQAVDPQTGDTYTKTLSTTMYIELKMVLFDAVDDKVLFQDNVTVEIEDFDRGYAESREESRSIVERQARPVLDSNAKWNRFLTELDKAGIEIAPGPYPMFDPYAETLSAFPYEYNGAYYDAILRSELASPGDAFNQSLDWSLEITKNNGQPKTIETGADFAAVARVGGYFVNPKRPQILVVSYVGKYTDWDNSAWETVLSGCLLDRGFGDDR